MISTVIFILVGSILFPAVGFYLDWKYAQKARKPSPKTQATAKES